MAYEEIEQYKKQLIEIIQRPKQAKGIKEDLQELAKKVGASTHVIHFDEWGNQEGREAGISILIDNIHTALQTSSMIETCRIATENCDIAQRATKAAICHYRFAAGIAILAMIAAWVAVFIYK